MGADVVPSRENPRFTAVRLPYKVQHDEADARAAMDFVGADQDVTLNIAEAVQGLAAAFAEAVGSRSRTTTRATSRPASA